MNKNDLLMAFSSVCMHIADNMQDLLLPNLDDDMHMITPILLNAHISDVDQWWKWDDHFGKYLAQLTEIETQIPGSLQENLDSGIEEIQENEMHWQQLKRLNSNSDDEVLNTLRYIPHVAEYASSFKSTKGFKKLDALTERMDSVFLWPMVTINTEKNDIRKAFYINVSIVSGDGKPLKPKIDKFRKFNA